MPSPKIIGLGIFLQLPGIIVTIISMLSLKTRFLPQLERIGPFLNKKGVVIVVFTLLAISLCLTVLVVNLFLHSKNLQNSLDKSVRDLNLKRVELKKVTSEDQFVKNKNLEEEIKNINATFNQSLSAYEALSDLQLVAKDTSTEKTLFARILRLLSERNYATASTEIASLSAKIKLTQEKIIAASTPPVANVSVNNSVPGSGYSRQKVQTSAGDFIVDIVAGNLATTKVVIDTASDETCTSNCPALPLADYVARSGAYAGINGTYFCPADYPSCASKQNSFDLLVMNKNKHYLNSDNNVYSTNPAAIFGNDWVRFVGAAQEWGRDTSVNGVISNFPLLVSGGNVVFGGNSDPKQGSRGNRSFVASQGSTVFIGVVHNVSVAESAIVLKTMGLENALNLDSGGSTALWFSGYKIGPGRNIPNAVLFVGK